MSKDKYRPSITDKEVVATSRTTELPPLTGGSLIPPGTDPTTDLPPGTGTGKNAPKNLRIVGQKAYYSPEGHQYVEVVFEWDEVAGATEYLLRIA